jgi:acyl-CoA thioester hydrolase
MRAMNEPERVHEKTIEIRWRDMDAIGHVNNAVYLNYLEETRDEWVDLALTGSGSSGDFVIARVAIDFRRELRQSDDSVVVSCKLVRVGRSSIVTQETIRTIGGELAAEAEAVLVARDATTGRSRPLTEDERARLEPLVV